MSLTHRAHLEGLSVQHECYPSFALGNASWCGSTSGDGRTKPAAVNALGKIEVLAAMPSPKEYIFGAPAERMAILIESIVTSTGTTKHLMTRPAGITTFSR